MRQRGARRLNVYLGQVKQGRQLTHKVNLRRVRVTIVAVQKQKYYILCLDLVIQHEKRVSHVAICGLPGSIMLSHTITPTTLISGKVILSFYMTSVGNILCVVCPSVRMEQLGSHWMGFL
jgi:hypothetical protein